MSRCLELSFVTARDGGGLNFWSVDHSGDPREQQQRGQLMALEALDLMARDDEGAIRHHLLAWVARDMASVDKDKTVALGFMLCMGAFAVIARENHGDGFYRQYLAKAEAAVDAIFAREKAERSERARNAANARWAKRDRDSGRNVIPGPWDSGESRP